jgi:hypothetical protein
MAWLLDVSGSMLGRRIAELKRQAGQLRQQVPFARLVSFATEVREVESLDKLPEPDGGTNLHLALAHAAKLSVAECVVFTDGHPADADACFAEAARIPGVVHCIFCGDPEDRDARDAIEFCRKLSQTNGGGFVQKDIAHGQSLLCGEVRDLLGLPAPISA